MQSHRYKLEDLKVGIWVYESELYDIYDTHIVLIHCKEVDPDEDEFIDIYGQIGFIGSEITKESTKLNTEESGLIDVYYKDKDEALGHIHYDY